MPSTLTRRMPSDRISLGGTQLVRKELFARESMETQGFVTMTIQVTVKCFGIDRNQEGFKLQRHGNGAHHPSCLCHLRALNSALSLVLRSRRQVLVGLKDLYIDKKGNGSIRRLCWLCNFGQHRRCFSSQYFALECSLRYYLLIDAFPIAF